MALVKRTREGWPLDTAWTQDSIDGAFREMLRSFFVGDRLVDRVLEGAGHVMRVEEYLDDGECVIRAELPGIDPDEDISITVTDGVLRLAARRTVVDEEERPEGWRSEFHYGRLERALRLPEGTSESEITATYKDGILEVRDPAPSGEQEQVPRTIPVSRG